LFIPSQEPTMNKTITLLAVSSLAFASKADSQKPQIHHFDKPLIVHDDEFRLYPYPEYSEYAGSYRPPYYPPPFFSEDRVLYDDEELFSIQKVEETVQKAAKFVKENPELVKQAEKKIEELVKRYSGNKDLLKKDAKKALKYVAEHPEVLKEAVEIVKGLNHHDDELFNLDQIIRDGVELTKEDIKNKDGKKLVKDIKEVLKNSKKFLEDNDQPEDNRLSIWGHIKNEFEKLETIV